MARNLNQGDYVCGGEYGTDDFDVGCVLTVERGRLLIGWSNGERTWTRPSDLNRSPISPNQWLNGDDPWETTG